jgi:MinD superfamily P-loop ATPase
MIKELAILSGKGGTGKTSVTASFAALAEKKVMTDCDVDAADLHLVLNPEIKQTEEYIGGKKAFINPGICTGCGRCTELCRFDAIDEHFVIDILSCEGCGVCAEFCPENAIEMKPHVSGRWFVSGTGHGSMVHAELGIAEGNSGKLVSVLRKAAKEKAGKEDCGLIITDGSPGIGCPVIASVTGASVVLLVTEPTVAGIHDLKRIHGLTKHFRVKTGVCVNKYDINTAKSREIESYCTENGLMFFGMIPYDRDVTEAQIEGKTDVEYSSGPASRAIGELWLKIKNEIFK